MVQEGGMAQGSVACACVHSHTHTHTHTGLLNTIFTSVISVPEHTAFFCLFNLVLFFPVTEMLVAACCACGRAGVGGGEGGPENHCLAIPKPSPHLLGKEA